MFSDLTWGEDRSAAYTATLQRAIAMLRDHPQIGRQRDDVFAGCRSIQVEQHVIYYHQPQAAVIEVLRVLHRRQEPTSAVGNPITSASEES